MIKNTVVKKTAFLSLFFLIIAFIAVGEEPFAVGRGTYYQVLSESGTNHAQSTAKKMDAFFDLYNTYFHFHPEILNSKLQVRIFRNKDNYDSYLQSILSETRDTFVYLQYRDPSRNVLVCYVMEDEAHYTRSLIHNGLIQFIKSFIPYPPLWMMKGFAVYFENSYYNGEQQRAVFRENNAWVDTLRTFLYETDIDPENSRLFPVSTFLFMEMKDARADLEAFYAQSWGLVEFLAGSEYKPYNRILWDSISSLDPRASKLENERAVVSRAFEWVNKDLFISDYADYIASMKTFPDFVEEGMKHYSSGRMDLAEIAFLNAMALESSSHIPYYYLGLLSYSRRDFTMAEYYYHSAMRMGAPADISLYALGVNAFAERRHGDAEYYLHQVLDLNDGPYTGKSSDLLARIEKGSTEGR